MANRDLKVTLSGDAVSLHRELAKAEAALHKYARSAQGAQGTVGKASQQTSSKVRKHAAEAVAANAALTGSFKSMARSAVTAGVGFASAYIGIAKAKAAIKTTMDLTHATVALHRNLGLTTKQASEWAAVAKARGVDTNALSTSFTNLSKAVQLAAGGHKMQTQALQALGFTQRDIQHGSKDFPFLLHRIADGFGKMEGGSRRAALAQVLLGRSSQTTLPIFTAGSKAMDQQLHLADKYHVTVGGKAVKSMKDLAEAQRELEFAQLGLQVQFTEGIAPSLIKVELAAAKVIRVFDDPKLSGDEKWKRISKIVGPLAKQLEHGAEQAMPKIANAVGHEAPKVAGAFVVGFLHADTWGKLAVGGWLLAKFGGIGAFKSIGRKAGGAMTGGMLEAEAGGVAGGALGRLKGVGRKWGAVLGKAMGGVAVASLIAQITKTENADPLLFLHPPAAGDPRPGHGDIQPRDTRPRGQRRADSALGAAQTLLTVRSGGNAPAILKDRNALKDYGAEAVRAARQIDRLNSAHGTARARAEALYGRVETLTSRLGKLKRGSSAYNDTAADLRKTQDRLAKALDGTRPAANKAAGGLNKVGDNAGFMGGAVAKAGQVVAGVTNSVLKSLGAKAIHFDIAAASKSVKGGVSGLSDTLFGKARGGLVQYGSPGEKGHDSIFTMLAGAPAVVAPGEKGAVFTGQQQGVMDYALANIGIRGLDGLFSTYNQPHYMAKGGYVFPFPKGSSVGWRRIDQGQDFQGTPGSPLVALGPGGVTQAPNDPGGFGPDYPLLTLTAGPLKGKTIYYGHTDIAKRGAVGAGEVMARTSRKGHNAPPGWAEIGFWPPGSMSAGNAIAPILHALAGDRVAAGAGAGGGAEQIGMPKIGGPSGALKSVVSAAARRMTKAANRYLAKKATPSVGALSAAASYTGKGAFRATSYGPPWGGIQGGGVTATNVDLRRAPHKYLVAVDPSVIPLHSQLRIWPNPFSYKGAFAAEDTGGAIKGKRIDFYDWRGRSAQNSWGSRSVKVQGFARGGFVGRQSGGFVRGGDGGSIADVIAAAANPFAVTPPKPHKGPKPSTHVNPITGHIETHTSAEWNAINNRNALHTRSQADARKREAARKKAAREHAQHVLSTFQSHVAGIELAAGTDFAGYETRQTELGESRDAFEQTYSLVQRTYELNAPDLTTAAGRAERIDQLRTLQGYGQIGSGTLRAKRQSVLGEANRARKLVRQLKQQLRRAPKKARPALQRKIAGAQRKILALRKQASQLGIDIGNVDLDALDLEKQIQDVEKQAPSAADVQLKHLEAAGALAALTPDAADDIAAATGLVGFYQGQLAWAQATGNDEYISTAAGNLKSAQDQLKSLTDAQGQSQADLVAALKELTDQVKRNNDFATSVAATDAAQIAKSFADLMNGQLVGLGLAGRQLTAGAGYAWRY